VAHAALGLAAAAHPELDDPAAGRDYRGDDPDGYLSASEVADLVTEYAAASAAPVVTGTTVTALRPGGEGFHVDTDRGRWNTRTVIVAAGTTRGNVPAVARRIPALVSIPALQYRNPDQLPAGGVLVVGASASGVQIADELQRSGRPVTLAAGEHVRVPRTYRGRDILWWLDATGILDERWDEVDDLVRARHLPSLQLVGASHTLDLNALQDSGVRLVGRFAGLRGGRGAVLRLAGANVLRPADLKQGRPPRHHRRPRRRSAGKLPSPPSCGKPPLELSLSSGEIRSVRVGHRLPARLLLGSTCRSSTIAAPAPAGRAGVTRWPGPVRARPCRCCATYVRPTSTVPAATTHADLAAHVHRRP
jgi:putative flavoprotein involved in K+ transport